MSQLADLLQQYFKQSEYKSVTALAKAAQQYASVSRAYISHILHGQRERPGYDKLLAVAQALHLSAEETNQLLGTAGHQPIPLPVSQLEHVQTALEQLARTPGVSPEAFEQVIEGLLQMIQGFHVALGTIPRPAALRPLPATSLAPEVGAVDDLLGEMLSRGAMHPLDSLFGELKTAAQGDRWEIKRRVAEALPKLAQLNPDPTLELAALLRQDYHPDWKADIRRRVIEAVPGLYPYRPDATLALLTPHTRDEIYVAIATVEALFDLQQARSLTAKESEPYVQALPLDEPAHREAITFLYDLLQTTLTDPDAALLQMNQDRAHPERITRICIIRTAPRLLP
ncbi:helix-turn-helix domain-containing protein, partial [Chloroflexota bacterium]